MSITTGSDESEGSTISNNQRYFMCLDEFQQIKLEARRMKGKISPFLTVYKRIIIVSRMTKVQTLPGTSSSGIVL